MEKNNNTLAIIALIVAVLGGLPGIVSTISYFQERAKSHPKLSASIPSFMTGSFFKDKDARSPDAPGCHILLTLTITNSGDTPIIPEIFDLKCKVGNRWYKFERFLIKDDIEWHSEMQKISLEKPSQKDLQRYKKPITNIEPAYGFLMFINEELSVSELRKIESIPIQLTCEDIFKKKHEIKLELPLNQDQQPTIYPKHGVSWEYIYGEK